MRPWLVAHEAATSILVYGEVIEYIRPRRSSWAIIIGVLLFDRTGLGVIENRSPHR
jgi:hypothetical protein